MRIADYLAPSAVILRLQGHDRDEVLAELSTALQGRATSGRGELFNALRAREEIGTTALEDGVAIPHCRLANLSDISVAVGLAPEGVAFSPEGGAPSRIFFAVAAPPDTKGLHLKVLARLSKLLRQPAVREAMLGAGDAKQLNDIINTADAALDDETSRRLRPGL
ncbi:MAG: PTS sugar transporter subunit IIA [Deltaproteobacteria bacterium]|nr:PTS sugar transporter subunit IIA [Deltaproteobacteria bacterium]